MATSQARERIVLVATQLFYSRGIHAVGVDEIVAQSGAAKTTLYAHFASKDELVAEYLRRWSESWRAYVDEQLAESGLPARGRIGLILTLLANGCEDPTFRGCPFINAAAEFPDPSHPARIAGDAHRAWIHDLFFTLSTEAAARDPGLLADWLCLLYDAAMVGAQLNPNGGAAWKSSSAANVLVESMLPRDG